MKILQIHNHYREGGGEDTVVAREAAVLRKAGHTVIEHQVANPAELVSTAASLLASPWNEAAARRVKAVIAQQRPDVAHVHNTWWAFTPSIVSTLGKAGVPVVMTLHNYRLVCSNAQLFRDGRSCEECVGTHPWRGVRYRCYRDSIAASFMAAGTITLNRILGTWDSVRVFLVLTAFARERFIAGGLPEEKVRIKANFVEDPGARNNLPSESPTVLYVGRISAEKGVDVLVEAWARASTPNLELVLVGDGPLRTGLQRSVPPGVRFLGVQTPEQIRKLMLSARALAFSSKLYEGQPMVVIEALAAGLPVAASDVGGVPETIADRTAGILVQPGNTASWISALERLEHATWVDKASPAARAVFEDRYTSEIGMQRLIDEYNQAAANYPT